MKNKGIYRVFRTKAEMQAHDEDIRHFSRVWMMDHVTVALGRMGFREAKFREFDKVLNEVVKEYMQDYSEDLKADKSMEYSRACLDREMQQYTGSMLCQRMNDTDKGVDADGRERVFKTTGKA